MNCDSALAALSAQLDGELSPGEAQALEAHLASCPHCRALREELSALHTLCAQEIEAPPQLKAAVMAALPPQEAPRKKTKVIPLYWRRLGAAAACLALVFLAVWRIGASPASNGPDRALEHTSPTPLPPENEAVLADSTGTYGGRAADTPDTDSLSSVNAIQNSLAPLAEEPLAEVEDVPAPEDMEVSSPAPDMTKAAFTSESAATDSLLLPDTDEAPPAADGGDTTTVPTDAHAGGGAPSVRMFLGAAAKVDTDTAVTNGAAADSVDEPPAAPIPESAMFSSVLLDEDPAAALTTAANDALFREVVLATATDVTYVGAVAVDSAPDGLVQSYRYRELEDGSVLYRLPSQQFQSLLDELSGGQVAYGLSDEGYCAVDRGQYGLLVILHPLS